MGIRTNLRGNWCRQKSEKLLIQNGLSHDAFEK